MTVPASTLGAERGLYAGLSGVQHGLGQNTVTLGGVIDQHVGDGTHQPPVLKDGRAGHALDDAAGGLQQPGI